MQAAAVILAAGRGSRMNELTAQRPKCLLELAGKTLLEWQQKALHEAGVGQILVVRGYLADRVTGEFATVENENWQNSNMLSSLLCAGPFAREAFARGVDRIIVSYSDIVYCADHVRRLLANPEHIAICYDEKWAALWHLRFVNVLDDAETFRQRNGLLLEIGGKTDNMARIGGQYMGLLNFDSQGWNILEQTCAQLGETTAKTDMTAFLRHLLAAGVSIGVTPVQGKWCEADNGEDLAKYEQAITGAWSHDWRD